MFSSEKKYASTQKSADSKKIRRTKMRWLNFFQRLKRPYLNHQDNVHWIRSYRSAGKMDIKTITTRRVAQKSRRNATLVTESGVRVSHPPVELTASRLWPLVIISIILLGAGLGYVAPKWLAQFPIQQVQLSGASHYVAQEQIKAAVEPYTGKGFFLVDLAVIQRSVSNIPWVETAKVTRKWPATLQIAVIERVPMAIWNGEYLISNKGELFKPEKIDALSLKLPSLAGPLSQSWLIMRQYQAVSELLQAQQLSLKTFSLTPYLSWEMMLNNGIILRVNRDHSIEKIKQFLRLYPRLRPVSRKIAYVDLRYQKGIAVGWKK